MPRKAKFRIKAEFKDLEKTPRGKEICPLCGDAGWGENWWELHRMTPHVQCVCGRVFLKNGLKRHQTHSGCRTEGVASA